MQLNISKRKLAGMLKHSVLIPSPETKNLRVWTNFHEV